MRSRHFTAIEQVVAADPRTLALEYHSLVTSTEHDSPSGSVRDAYAAVVHAVGVFQHRSAFLDAVRALEGERFLPLRTKLVCKTCGGDDVTADACAAWDPAARGYSLVGTYDDHTCQSCGRDGSYIVDSVPIAPEPGERVRISGPASGEAAPHTGRTGTVARPNHVRGGLYVTLDPFTGERVQAVALVPVDALEVAA